MKKLALIASLFILPSFLLNAQDEVDANETVFVLEKPEALEEAVNGGVISEDEAKVIAGLYVREIYERLMEVQKANPALTKLKPEELFEKVDKKAVFVLKKVEGGIREISLKKEISVESCEKEEVKSIACGGCYKPVQKPTLLQRIKMFAKSHSIAISAVSFMTAVSAGYYFGFFSREDTRTTHVRYM